MQDIEEGLRVDADPENQNDQRRKDENLAQIQISHPRVVRLELTHHGALIEPEQVGCPQDDTQSSDYSPRRSCLEGALQDSEFANKTIQQR